jgi:hypothetical protein
VWVGFYSLIGGREVFAETLTGTGLGGARSKASEKSPQIIMDYLFQYI